VPRVDDTRLSTYLRGGTATSATDAPAAAPVQTTPPALAAVCDTIPATSSREFLSPPPPVVRQTQADALNGKARVPGPVSAQGSVSPLPSTRAAVVGSPQPNAVLLGSSQKPSRSPWQPSATGPKPLPVGAVVREAPVATPTVASTGASGAVTGSSDSHPGAVSDRSRLEKLDDNSDTDSFSDESSSNPELQANVIVGPTQLAVQPMRLEDLWIPANPRFGEPKAPIRSGPYCLALSDVRRLSGARSDEAPLSFGTVKHLIFGSGRSGASCRPCMFERWAGRCNKSWLCDFCHLHMGQRHRPVHLETLQGTL